MQPRVILSWSAYEHEHIERDRSWYISLAVTALSLALVSVLFHDVFFAVLILVAAATIGIHAREVPPLSQFEISDRGIRIDHIFHRYDDITGFWVEEEEHDGRPLLLISTIKVMHAVIVIPIEQIDPHRIHTYLLEHCEEVPMHEPVAHKILAFFGF